MGIKPVRPFYIVLVAILIGIFGHSSKLSKAAELQSTNFKIEGDSQSPAPGPSDSTNYGLQGEINPTTQSVSSSNFINNIGFLGRIQANTPYAPTLSNPAQYYDRLLVTLNESSNPSDATFVIAITTDASNWATTEYVQADGTLGSTPVYQTYTQWGGASGSLITGLNSDTGYKVKALAKRGDFTETSFGPESTTVETVSPFITLGLSDQNLYFPILSTSSIEETPLSTLTVNTNAQSGYTLKISDQGDSATGGLYQATTTNLIDAVSATLSAGTEGYGLQASSSTATIASIYNHMGTDIVGIMSLTSANLSSNTAPVTDETTLIRLKSAINATTTAGEYVDLLYFTVTPSL